MPWSPLLPSVWEGGAPGAVSQPLGPGPRLRPRLPPGCSCPASSGSPERPSRSPARSSPAASPHSRTRGLRGWTHSPGPCAGSAAQSWRSPGGRGDLGEVWEEWRDRGCRETREPLAVRDWDPSMRRALRSIAGTLKTPAPIQPQSLPPPSPATCAALGPSAPQPFSSPVCAVATFCALNIVPPHSPVNSASAPVLPHPLGSLLSWGH